MPKDSDRRELTREEIEQKQKEKFNTFFTTSVAQVPEEMINPTRSSEQPDSKHGLLARFFGKKEKASGVPPQEQEPEDDTFWSDTPIAPAPTGEIVLDGSAPEAPPEPGPSLEELTLELEGGEEAPAPAPRQQEPAPQPPKAEEPPVREEAGLEAAKLAAKLEQPWTTTAEKSQARRAAARQAAQAAYAAQAAALKSVAAP